MDKTLVKQSSFLYLKSKFFLYRIVTYFTFFLVPIILTKSVSLDIAFQSFILLFYMLFMASQWYLLGKEIDYRLKIYYKANSSMDRILYRFLLGNIVMLVVFNLASLLPSSLYSYIYWSIFSVLGIFYSWPTRGKIIQESITDQFYEFKFLDSFERTVFLLIALMFLFTLPELPLFQNVEALKLYFDPQEKIHSILWNFLQFNYYPFLPFTKIYAFSWSLHFYLYGMGFLLLSLYCLLRFFVSRRLSIMGVFSLISSWSVSRFLEQDYLSVYWGSFLIIWAWSILWSSKSSTYRSGFFIGLIHFWGTCINIKFFFLMPVHLLISYFISMEDKTSWYKKQWMKYTLMGGILSLLVFVLNTKLGGLVSLQSPAEFFKEFLILLKGKSFYILSILGLGIFVLYQALSSLKYFKEFSLDKKNLKELNFIVGTLLVFFVVFGTEFFSKFSLMWFVVFLSILPLEWIFQSISRLRSRRNLIYALYILVCLLDSHFEGRVRIVGKMLLNEDLFKYIQAM